MASPDLNEKKLEVLKLFEGLGTEDVHDFVRTDFPFNDSKYFTEPEVIEMFMVAFKDGFLDKEGHFNLYSKKNRRDTFRLFDLFYFAKDFQTFLQIAQWAKKELNALQFVYALTSALYHRQDVIGVIPPKFYLSLPMYFVTSQVMHQAYRAKLHGVECRKFDVTNTGHESTWYRNQTLDMNQYRTDLYSGDPEARLSYFREDVDFSDWYCRFVLQMAPWKSDRTYPAITFDRRGEYIYTIMHWVLGKYNLERYANGLPPVQPIDFTKPIKTGYNAELTAIGGRPMLARPDGLNPSDTDPVGVDFLQSLYQRYRHYVDHHYSNKTLDQISNPNIHDVAGLERLTNLVFGTSDPNGRKYYKPLLRQALETLDVSVSSFSDIGRSGSPVGNFLTELRDPAFYRVLAYLEKLFKSYDSMKTPYTKEELDFPGVKINSIHFTKLETYFERYEFNISNGVPSKGSNHKYMASKIRLNSKPFTYKINVQSEREVKAAIVLSIAPSTDSSLRPNGVKAFTNSVGFDFFRIDLKAGENTVERDSTTIVYYKQQNSSDDVTDHKSEDTNKPHHPLIMPSFEFEEAFPANLLLPSGSKGGTEYKMAVYIMADNTPTEEPDSQGLSQENPSQSFHIPFDRPTSEHIYKELDNLHFVDVTIYDSTKYPL